jgi:hypothetical protein
MMLPYSTLSDASSATLRIVTNVTERRVMAVDRFAAWFDAVDRIVEKRVGMSVRDLPDCSYRDWFDDGITANQAARLAIEEAGG